MNIKIYECFRTSLYFPVYFALKNYLKFSDSNINQCITTRNGDKEAYDSLVSHKDKNTIPFALGDPIQAYLAEKDKNDTKVIFNLIDTIPIWGVTNKQELIEKSRNKPRYYISDNDFENLRVSTYKENTTTYHLFDYYLRKESELSEKERPSSIISKFGQNEFDYLFKIVRKKTMADISLTLEPFRAFYEYKDYLRKYPEYLKERKGIVSRDLKIVYKFKPILFSFTALMTKKFYLKKYKDEITEFLKSVHQAKHDAYENTDLLIDYRRNDQNFSNLDRYIVSNSIFLMINCRIFPCISFTPKRAWDNATKLIKRVQNIDKDPRDFEEVVDNEIVKEFY